MSQRMNRRRFLQALAGSTLATALAACAQPAATPASQVVKETVVVAGTPQVVEKVITPTSAPAAPVDLTYSTWRPLPEQELLTKLIGEQFNAKYPNIKVNVIGASYGEYYKKIVTMAAGGTPVDAIHTDSVWIPSWASQGLLVDIAPMVDASPTLSNPDLLWPNLPKFVQYSGKTYGIPFGVSVCALYYNTDVFDEAGLEPPDASWKPADIMSAAAALTKDTQWGMDPWTGWVAVEWAISFFGGKTVDDDWNPTKCTLDEPAAVEAVDWWGEWHVKYAPKNPDGTEFYQKRTAMKFMWGSQIVPNRMNMQDDNWDLVPCNLISPVPLDEQALKVGIHSQGMGAATRAKGEAWQFLEWLSTDYVETWARELGYAVPAVKSVALSDAYMQPDKPPKNIKALVDMMNTGQAPWIWHPKVEEIHTIMAQEWDKVLNGMATAQEVHAGLVPKVDALLAEK